MPAIASATSTCCEGIAERSARGDAGDFLGRPALATEQQDRLGISCWNTIFNLERKGDAVSSAFA